MSTRLSEHVGVTRAGLAILVSLLVAAPAAAQFRDDFDALALDEAGLNGWAYFTGDGLAEMTLSAVGAGQATILVDASRDERGIWWALIKRRVSRGMDLDRLAQPGHELRIAARVRVSDAPRRLNLHLNTQRTTDFHSHLMEFDIPTAGTWHTISMTTHGFDARPGDTVFGQLALMDWGPERYRVDVDYLEVHVVDSSGTEPDSSLGVPYHPAIPPLSAFHDALVTAEAAVVDLDHPGVNLGGWSVSDGAGRTRLLTVGGRQFVIMRFDLSRLSGMEVKGSGLLELTTHTVLRSPEQTGDFGLVRVAEILAGDPSWRAQTVTAESLREGRPLAEVVNPQMIIDWPVVEKRGAKTYFTISRPVLQRMVEGRTLGLALRPLGSVSASFLAQGPGPRLLLNVSDE